MNKYDKYVCTILIMLILTLLVGTVVGQDASAGMTVFNSRCEICHKIGGSAPNMTVLSNESVSYITDKVRNGVNRTAMIAYNPSVLSDNDLSNVIAYISSQKLPMTTTTPTMAALPTTTTTTVMPTSTPKSSGFDIILGVIGILIIYIFRHR
jgi:cytochrome c553